MRASGQRAAVGQAHLARSEAAIRDMAKAQGKRAPQPARYAFRELLFDQVLAFKARAGAKTVLVEGKRLPARAPRTDLEREAVARFEARRKLKAQPVDHVALMAGTIVKVTIEGRAVSRIDFTQAGVPKDLIRPNFDAAMAQARQIEPRLDAMVAA